MLTYTSNCSVLLSHILHVGRIKLLRDRAKYEFDEALARIRKRLRNFTIDSSSDEEENTNWNERTKTIDTSGDEKTVEVGNKMHTFLH